jgi:flagellar hook-associated protein 2
MGTVGLSFGSPTSGAGFDVSSTVASIVSNLQNVETPWKTQLTALEGQDTAISSLGTLFSNLSNDMSSLTDLEGILAQKTGSSSDTNVLSLTAADSTAIAGTHTVEVTNLAQTSSGYLAPLANASSALTGSITIQAGAGGTPQTITLNSSDNTLAGLASAINASGVGVTAAVLTDASGSRLSLVSGTSGGDGNIVVSANSIAAYVNYTGTAGNSAQNSSGSLGEFANSSDTLSGSLSIQVGSGAAQTVTLDSSDNTLSGLMDAINTAGIGVTASVVTNSDGTSSLALASQTAGSAGTLTVTSSILDASTSSLGYTSSVTGKDANLTVDGIALTSASNTVADLIPGVTFQLLAPSTTESDGSLEQVQVVIGNDNTDVESTVNQFVTDYNALVSAMNTQEGNTAAGTPEPLFGSPTLSLLQQQLQSGLNTQNPNGSLASVATGLNTTLTGSISIAVGSGTAQTVTLPSSGGTLSSLAAAINSASIGVAASVVTSNGESTLSLLSQTEGSNGALSVTSNVQATGDAALSYSGLAGNSTQNSAGAFTSVLSASDVLAGSISIQVGSGVAQTIALNSSNNTLAGLANAINTAALGVTASVITNSDGSSSLSLLSQTAGSAGTLAVTSSLLDTTNTTTTTLNYTDSSDIGSLTALGISVNNDGSISLDANSLDSVLNSDYNSVVGFFQASSGWGQTFAATLISAGSGSSGDVLGLAARSNSSIEATLNADITKENSVISAQQVSLTAELNSANQIMQQLPSQLNGVNELYSAITGYNENLGG